MKGLGALALYAPLGAAACGAESKSTGGGPDVAGGAAGSAGIPADGSGGGATTSTPGTANGAGNGTIAGSGGTPGTVTSSGGAPPAMSGGGSGATGSGVTVSGGAPTGTAGAAGATSADAGSRLITPPMFDDFASCTLTTTDIEGPFFIDDDEIPNDVSLIRSDVREGLPGCEFRLSFRLLDAKTSCAPIAGAEMYIWHCNADGLYSGFDGQDPSKPYMGSPDPSPTNLDRFCRGVQSSDASGIVSFTTLYPGWYAGRPLHLHLVARMKGTTPRMITTQLYFPAAFTKEVHTTEPAYQSRAANIPPASLNPPGGKPAIPTLKHTAGLVVGTLNVIVDRA
jgi:protocatechuate 3,4-dioxygenase beta subunit